MAKIIAIMVSLTVLYDSTSGRHFGFQRPDNHL